MPVKRIVPKLCAGRRAYLFPWKIKGGGHPEIPETLVPIIVDLETAATHDYVATTILLPHVEGTYYIYTDHLTNLCIAQHYKDQFQLELLHAG